METMLRAQQIIYVMADDGLLFRFLASVSIRTKVPLNATFCVGALAGEGACADKHRNINDIANKIRLRAEASFFLIFCFLYTATIVEKKFKYFVLPEKGFDPLDR